MILHALMIAANLGSPTTPTPSTPAAGPLLAIRVKRAETVAKGTIEHAVILVEGGKIVTIGEDLPIERGIPVLDRPDWIVIPGLVDAYSRLGLDSEGAEDMSPEVHASGELYPGADEYKEVVKYGVTTLGLYPAGNGIPGQAVAVRPIAKTREEMVLQDPAYLKVILRATANSKKALQDGFKKADDYIEKEKKAKEKWDKEQEKKKKAPAKKSDEKSDDKKGEEKKGDEKKSDDKKSDEKSDEPKSDGKDDSKPAADVFVPPEPDPKAKPFLDLRSGKLRALVSISNAAEYLHLLDAIGKEKFAFDLRIPMSRELDIFYVAKKKDNDLEVDGIGDRKLRVVLEPSITFHPGTMRQRNLPMELSQAGAKLVLIPRNDALPDFKMWLPNTGELVWGGLDPKVALRAMTLEPAELLGVGGRIGSLEKGKDANMVFLNGDPFEPATRIQAVMLDGRIVFGEVNL